MKLPAIVLPPLVWREMALWYPLITSPRTVLPPAVMVRPMAASALGPESSMSGTALIAAVIPFVFALEPGWLKPSIVTGSVISGRSKPAHV